MRLLSWNIRHGGGRRLPAICDAIIKHAPDVIIIAEYRSIPGKILLSRFAEAGWPYAVSSQPPPRENGVAVFSRAPLVPSVPPPDRWVEVELPLHGLAVAAVHVPVRGRDISRKDAYWRSVLEHASNKRRESFVFIGDWNTGAALGDAQPEGTGFSCCEHFHAMAEHGFVDAWRLLHSNDRAFSWYSRRRGSERNGFRIDQAFLSTPLIDRLTSCEYGHDERRAGISDHAPLLLDIRGNHE
jgi:exodeoxyribonuclease-3